MGFETVEDRFVEIGSESPLLLLHGLIGTLSDPGIIDAFHGQFVHCPDLLGYGSQRDVVGTEWSLDDQVTHVSSYLKKNDSRPVHIVGHSVGGAVGVLFAAKFPELVCSVTSVEGNMTLEDAFWSANIAAQPLDQVEAMLQGFRSDTDVWLNGAGVVPTEWTRCVAAAWLNSQPASTIQAQARAVVEATGNCAYLEKLHWLLDSPIPLHLLAGQRSIDNWHVPEQVLNSAQSCVVLPDCGHLMMLEKPESFAHGVLEPLSQAIGSHS